MSVHYKFKNTLTQFETVKFSEDSISLSDFKRKVVEQKHLSHINDDLKVINAETKQEYKNDATIPKNTSVIVSRVPLTPQPKTNKKVSAPKPDVRNTKDPRNNRKPLSGDDLVIDLSKLNISEEKKIEVMIQQSAAVYDPKTYKKLPPSTNVPPPKSYQCKRCHLSGHWIQNCPIIVMSKLKYTETRGKAGIPRSFLQEKQNPNHSSHTMAKIQEEKSIQIPEHLICPICKDIFVDAVMIPCCGNSFCDDCIRNSILETKDNECPSCKETDISPDDLIPNRYLRKTVVSFKAKGGAVHHPITTSNKTGDSK